MINASLATLGTVMFLSVALVWRTMSHWRRTGDTGLRGLSSWSGLAFLGGATMIVVAPVLMLARVGRALVDGGAAQSVLGVLLLVAGLVATALSQASMRESWRIGVDPSERTRLVTGGMFAIVRNPIFSSIIVAAIGVVVLAPTALAFVGLAVLVGAIELQVRAIEEPYLRAHHGAQYADYCRRVGRFLPRLAPGRRRAKTPQLMLFGLGALAIAGGLYLFFEW